MDLAMNMREARGNEQCPHLNLIHYTPRDVGHMRFGTELRILRAETTCTALDLAS